MYSLFVLDFNENLILSMVFSEDIQISNCIELRPEGAEL